MASRDPGPPAVTMMTVEQPYARAVEAVDRALEHDKEKVAAAGNPWRFDLAYSSHLHERARSLLWAAELSLRIVAEKREGRTDG